MKIFISHSSKDLFVKHFVVFLTSIGINPNDIFCSSLEGQGVKNGSRINDSIKREFNEANLIIYLISHNFLDSTFCTQELGALWSFDEKSRFIFKFDDVTSDDICGFIDSSYKYNLVNSDGLANLYDEVSELFNLKNKQAVINRSIDSLLTNLRKEIDILIEEKDKTKEQLEEERISKLERQYYELSIGEKIIIGSIYFSDDPVGYYSLSNGIVGLLEKKSFLIRTTNVSTAFQLFPYALQPWVRNFIKNNQAIQKELMAINKEKGIYLQEDPFDY